MTYEIYEGLFEKVEKKLNRIAKKCAKFGNPFTFEVVGDTIKEGKDEDGNEVAYKFLLVEVEGTAKIDDWEFVATLENHTDGNIIKRVADVEVPQRFWTTDNVCEHCGTRRERKLLYIVHNVETDEWKQVGKQCLILYTGGLNAEYVTSWYDGILELEEFDGFFPSGGEIYYEVDDVLAYASELIDKLGYMKAWEDYSLPSTKKYVRELIVRNDRMTLEDRISRINNDLKANRYDERVLKSDFNKEETAEKVEKIIEYYLNLYETKRDNEFINNMGIILKEGYVTYGNIGYLCYLPQGYNKHIADEKARAIQKKANAASKHFGEEKKRYKDLEAIAFDYLYSFDNQFGGGYCYRIILKSGEILIWKTSKSQIEMIGDQIKEWDWEKIKLEMYTIDTITFTVKKHTEYNGVPQTEITRAIPRFKNLMA